jgi:threonylcarbamoyladenosine tRNA methylthiotransferase MtaB
MKKTRKFFLTTLGCKVNQFETEAIGLTLKEAGWEKTAKHREADLCVINTCTVTGKASMQSRQAIRNIVRQCPDAYVIVTGCYAQTEADEILKIDGVDRIVSHREKHLIPRMLDSMDGIAKPHIPLMSPDCNESCDEKVFRSYNVQVHGNRTRPFLKIQDGCDAFCTYCIVPHTRGRSRSMEADEVLSRLHELGRSGYLEVVLTGIHIGAWGSDLGMGRTFYDLLSRIEDERPVPRIRISSIEPRELTGEILDLFARSSMFCRHVHIPFQSGDSGVLKRMNRPYTREYLEDLVHTVKDLLPDAAVGADLLSGFPGETDEAFRNTFSLIESLPIMYLHVFPFSARKRTPAATFPGQVGPETMRVRTEALRDLGALKRAEFLKRMEGKEAEVLIENKRDRKTGLLKGLTSNYAVVHVDGPDSLYNTLIHAVIEKAETSFVTGRLPE